MVEQRYLLQTKKNRKGATKRFILGWTPGLADRKDLREVSKDVADAVLRDEYVPIEAIAHTDSPNGMVAVHVKKEFIAQVLAFIETLEAKAVARLPATADFPEIAMVGKGEAALEQGIPPEIKEINGIQSKNAVEAYIKNKKIDVTITRRDTLSGMKEKVIKCLST